MRKKPYSEKDLYDLTGKYGLWNTRTLTVMLFGTFIGWGFVTNTFAGWLSWQGYFLWTICGKDGGWAYANIGVLLALAIGCAGYFLLSRREVSRQ